MFKPISILLMASALFAAGPQPERWSLLSSGEKKGSLVMTPAGKRTFRIHNTYFIRGWKDDLRGTLTRDATGFPSRFELQGTQESVAGYRETFQVVNGRAHWSLPGEVRKGVLAGGFYLPSAAKVLPVSLLWMAETAEIQQGRSLQIITGGLVTASKPTTLELTVKGRPVRLQQQVLLGLGLCSFYLWRDADGRPLASMTTGDMAIREGQEDLAGPLVEAAEKDLRSRMHALGSSAKLDFGTTYALTHVDVFDPNTLSRKLDQTVIVEGGRIRAIGPSADTRLPEGVRTLPCQGRTLLPGLWDSHYHIGIRE